MISSRIALSTVRNVNASPSDADGARPSYSPGSYVDNFALEQSIIDIKSRYRPPARQCLFISMVLFTTSVAIKALLSVHYARADVSALARELGVEAEPAPLYPVLVPAPAVLIAPIVFVLGWKFSSPLVYEVLRRRDAQDLGKRSRKRFRCSVGAGIVGAAMAMGTIMLLDAPVLYVSLAHAAKIAHQARAALGNSTLPSDAPAAVQPLLALTDAPRWLLVAATSTIAIVAVGGLLAVHAVVAELEMVSLHRTLQMFLSTNRVDHLALQHFRFSVISIFHNMGKTLRLRTLVVEASLAALTVSLQALNLVGMCTTFLAHAQAALPAEPSSSEYALLAAAAAMYAACGLALLVYSAFASSANRRGERWLIATPRILRWAPFGVLNLIASVAALAVRSLAGVHSVGDTIWMAASAALVAPSIAAAAVAYRSPW